MNNCFIAKSMNLEELNEFIHQLSEIVLENYLEEWNRNFAMRCLNMDYLMVADKEKDFERLKYLLTEYYMASQASIDIVRNVCCFRNISKYTTPDFLKVWDSLTLREFIYNQQVEHFYRSMQNFAYGADSFKNVIYVLSTPDNKIIIKCIHNEPLKVLHRILEDKKYKKFIKEYQLQEYTSEKPVNNVKITFSFKKKHKQKLNDYNWFDSKYYIPVLLFTIEQFLDETRRCTPQEFIAPSERATKFVNNNSCDELYAYTQFLLDFNDKILDAPLLDYFPNFVQYFKKTST